VYEERHSFLNSAIDAGELLDTRSDRINSVERDRRAHFIEGCVNTFMGREKSLTLAVIGFQECEAFSLVAILIELSRFPKNGTITLKLIAEQYGVKV
jgi:hypothetical protein